MTQSIYNSDNSSLISSTLFSFDDEIVTSQAYRRVLAKAYGSSDEKPSQNSLSEDDNDLEKESEQLSGLQLRDIEHRSVDGGKTTDVQESPEATQMQMLPLLSPTPTDPLSALMQTQNWEDSRWEDSGQSQLLTLRMFLRRKSKDRPSCMK